MRTFILESVLLAASCSIDAFAASFAYGSKKIRIPLLSNQVINLICGLFLGISLLLGSVVRQYLPGHLTTAVCVSILFIIGLSKLLDSATKSIIRKHNSRGKENLSRELRFSMFNFSFILSLYASPEEADINADRVISPVEAAALAVSLSLDGIAVGFGAAFGGISLPAVVFASLMTNTLAVFAGCGLGNRLARSLPFNVSWLSGAVLIGLAVSKLIS